jgi:hypothetical protein
VEGRQLALRVVRRQRLKAEVRRLFAVHGGKAGSPRITAGLRQAGWRVSENTVAALIAEQHLAARRKRRRKGTTRPGKGPLAGAGPGQTRLPGREDQPQVVRRRDRDRH